VGGEETVHVDVRVISATNAVLDEMCWKGEFRKDLYYRLNVFPIEHLVRGWRIFPSLPCFF